jgi:hypothetical protein
MDELLGLEGVLLFLARSLGDLGREADLRAGNRLVQEINGLESQLELAVGYRTVDVELDLRLAILAEIDPGVALVAGDGKDVVIQGVGIAEGVRPGDPAEVVGFEAELGDDGVFLFGGQLDIDRAAGPAATSPFRSREF